MAVDRLPVVGTVELARYTGTGEVTHHDVVGAVINPADPTGVASLDHDEEEDDERRVAEAAPVHTYVREAGLEEHPETIRAGRHVNRFTFKPTVAKVDVKIRLACVCTGFSTAVVPAFVHVYGSADTKNAKLKEKHKSPADCMFPVGRGPGECTPRGAGPTK